jgi:hypothetical protein
MIHDSNSRYEKTNKESRGENLFAHLVLESFNRRTKRKEEHARKRRQLSFKEEKKRENKIKDVH